MVTKRWDFPLLSFSGSASGGVKRNRRFGTIQFPSSLGEHEAEASEPEAIANAPLKLTAVFKARKADSAAPKLEPKPPPAISVVVRLLTNKSSSSSLMVEPLIAATQVFDHMQQPDSTGVEQALSLLLDHYDSKGFAALGGERSEVRREWTRLNS